MSVYGSLRMMLVLSAHAPLFCGDSYRSCFDIVVSRNFHLIKFPGSSYKETKSIRNCTASTELTSELFGVERSMESVQTNWLNTRNQVSSIAIK